MPFRAPLLQNYEADSGSIDHPCRLENQSLLVETFTTALFHNMLVSQHQSFL
jgi:hypothetical protein